MSEQYYYRVNGINDASGEAKIESVVKQLNGVELVEADYETSMVYVKGVVSASDVTDAINAAGYNAILVAE